VSLACDPTYLIEALTSIAAFMKKRALTVVHLFALDGLLALTFSLKRACTA
jgi:hypothetical protein